MWKLIFALLAIIGIAEVGRWLWLWLLKSKKKGKIYFVFSFHGHEKEAEVALRGAVHRLRMYGGTEEKKVLCLDRGMDEETKRVCKLTARDTQMVEICSEEELANLLKSSFANT